MRASHDGSSIELLSADLTRLAARVNPRRPYLFVSTVLAKHMPVAPERAVAAGIALALIHLHREGYHQPSFRQLAAAIRDPVIARALVATEPSRGRPAGPRVLVVGMAETATGLGHAVADVIAGARYVHTTRHNLGPGCLDFSEDHSHAPKQRLYLEDEHHAQADGSVIVVDDEISTGRTALNLIRAIHSRAPRERYVVLSLIETLAHTDHEAIRREAAELRTEISLRSLLSLPEGRMGLDQELPVHRRALRPRAPGPCNPIIHRIRVPGRVAARRPLSEAERARLQESAQLVAARLVRDRRGPAHVLGTEEFMYFPLAVASLMGPQVVVSSTTRSPVAISTADGYPIQRGLAWEHPDGELRYAYNTPASSSSEVFVMVEEGWGDRDLGALLGALGAAGVRRPHLVLISCPP